MFIESPLKLSVMVAAFTTLFTVTAQAQVFEVIHPDVDQGEVELELLTGFVLENVDDGEEQSAYELAVGYGVTSFWKTTIAVEFADVEGDGFEYEGFEWENVLLLPLGDGDHDHGGDEGVSLEALGLYFALEIPRDGGIDDGAIVVGPLAEARFGPVETIANLFVEFPFEDGEDEALIYTLAAAVDVTESTAVGLELFGEVESAFTSGTESELFIGPAAYFDVDLGGGRAIEPRIAVLFGTESEQPDAVLSINAELKF
ncbi:MAG: hypothetical protein AAGF53_16810 [Pseudomonadota bacterium]